MAKAQVIHNRPSARTGQFRMMAVALHKAGVKTSNVTGYPDQRRKEGKNS